ncbi:MAG: Fpg/Nei family DNA glycosylase [Candidatus Odinarchaeota archaeon]
MPELPEVETFKRYLDKTSLNQIIKNIKVVDNRVLSINELDLKKIIINNKFESSKRHGKYLLIYIGQKYLIMHFGMTGDLKYFNKKEHEPKYSKIIFQFNNDFNLAYISLRMFGKIDITDSIEEFVEKKNLGIDAYKMNFEEFKGALRSRTGIIKNLLLNQSFIAGIGNIYSDEILFRTKIHPNTKIDSLSESKTKELYTNIKDVLKIGIEKKGDLSTYPEYFIIPHRKKDDYCPICNSRIERIELSGRHGFYCPNCQKESI